MEGQESGSCCPAIERVGKKSRVFMSLQLTAPTPKGYSEILARMIPGPLESARESRCPVFSGGNLLSLETWVTLWVVFLGRLGEQLSLPGFSKGCPLVCAETPCFIPSYLFACFKAWSWTSLSPFLHFLSFLSCLPLSSIHSLSPSLPPFFLPVR